MTEIVLAVIMLVIAVASLVSVGVVMVAEEWPAREDDWEDLDD
jgi:hypothetical protein